jgi:hypothetical protein
MADDQPRGFEIGEGAYLLATNDGDDWTTMLAVLRERQHQREIGYTKDHDDDHSLGELVHTITNYLDRLPRTEDNPVLLQHLLVQVSAVAIAAASSVRRKQQLRFV